MDTGANTRSEETEDFHLSLFQTHGILTTVNGNEAIYIIAQSIQTTFKDLQVNAEICGIWYITAPCPGPIIGFKSKLRISFFLVLSIWITNMIHRARKIFWKELKLNSTSLPAGKGLTAHIFLGFAITALTLSLKSLQKKRLLEKVDRSVVLHSSGYAINCHHAAGRIIASCSLVIRARKLPCLFENLYKNMGALKTITFSEPLPGRCHIVTSAVERKGTSGIIWLTWLKGWMTYRDATTAAEVSCSGYNETQKLYG